MTTYDKGFKEEAVKLAEEIGTKKASEQLGISYNTLTNWRQKKNKYGQEANVGSGNKRKPASRQEQQIQEPLKIIRYGFFTIRLILINNGLKKPKKNIVPERLAMLIVTNPSTTSLLS